MALQLYAVGRSPFLFLSNICQYFVNVLQIHNRKSLFSVNIIYIPNIMITIFFFFLNFTSLYLPNSVQQITIGEHYSYRSVNDNIIVMEPT